MARRSVAVAMLVSGLLVAGCAHSAGSVSNVVADDQSSILVPPKMLPSGAQMRLRSTSSRPFRGTVEIPVDVNGRPEPNRIRVTGTMSALMKRDLEEYIVQLLFIPAKRDGVPVPGVFKMTFR